MSRIRYKVGDVLTLEVSRGVPITIQITETRHMSSAYNNHKGYIKYTYKILLGSVNHFHIDDFDEGCILWKEDRIKRVPLLKAKLYE